MAFSNELGISFAPTAENALEADHRGRYDGVPEAIRVISLNLPRVRGARGGISPLVGGQGAGGFDPYLSALLQTLTQTRKKNPNVIPGVGGGSSYPAPTPPPARDPNIIVQEPPAPDDPPSGGTWRPPNPQLPGPFGGAGRWPRS